MTSRLFFSSAPLPPGQTASSAEAQTSYTLAVASRIESAGTFMAAGDDLEGEIQAQRAFAEGLVREEGLGAQTGWYALKVAETEARLRRP